MLSCCNKIGFFPWGRKYRKEDDFRKTVSQYGSEGVKKEIKKQAVSSELRLTWHVAPAGDWPGPGGEGDP